MTGNSFGNLFKVTTFGESHGKALGVTIDGCPAGLKISEKEIQKELDKRKPGQSSITTQRKEEDKIEILSGIFNGKTLGTPISMIIYNNDSESEDYEKLKNVFRPGHADFTWTSKYGVRDHRGGGRASGRETIARVAAGAIAKKFLAEQGIKIIGHTIQIHKIKAKKFDEKEIEKNAVKCADKKAAKKMISKIIKIKKQGNSVGGIIEVKVKNMTHGIGEPVFNKLNAVLAHGLMSIPAVKGVEFGSGFKSAEMTGFEHNDEIYFDKKSSKIKFRTDNSGGVLGGISTGQDIVMRIAIKPASSIELEQKTIDEKGRHTKINVKGRHDPCIVPRAVPVAEAMTAIALADMLMFKRINKLK